MKSVRLGPDLEAKLSEAARVAGVSESELIRGAIDERSGAILADRLDSRLTGLIGAVRSKGGRATKAHERYRELLKQRTTRKPKSQR